MKRFLFFIFHFSFFILPAAAVAAAPIVIGGLIGAGAIAGFSVFRSFVPVDMADAYSFFSTCWTCDMFGNIMRVMSDLLPRAYDAIGAVVWPVAVALTAVWFAWKLVSGYINQKPEEPWSIAGTFGTHIVKLGLVCALLAFPLPRLLGDAVIAPVFTVGLAINHVVGDSEKFNECIVATTLREGNPAQNGMYSPRLRHSLSCELANVHAMTAIGMTAGWTMLNMAFNADYMHKAAGVVPLFPNLGYFFTGILILALFFWALLPVPLYFLEIFIKLSMNLIMLPMFLIGWLFDGWKDIIPGNGAASIKDTVNEVVKGTVGIALVGVFVTFSIMFLNAVFGASGAVSRLSQSIASGDASVLMDGLAMRGDGIIVIILMGLFIAMFMSSIPALIKSLFSIEVSQDFYTKAEATAKTIWGNMKNWYNAVAKAAKSAKK